MADARHRFVPTEKTVRRPDTRRPLPAAAAWGLVLGAVFFVARPILTPARGGDARARFTAHRVEFRLLKDMLLDEPGLASVGPDNVREYWLFDGRWSSPRRPGVFLSRREVLEAAGLAPARYDAYLDLLKTVGGYRAVRSGAGREKRVTVHLFPSGGDAGAAPRAVFDPARRPSGGRSEPLGDGWFLERGPA